ncbi:hypothetical protein PFISCL1PPCAC_4017, partial [Pristionchus fissidentatus]
NIFFFCLMLLRRSNGFLIGDCIGPRNALERHLDKNERSVLRSIVHERFSGNNQQEVMRLVLTFVRSRLDDKEWIDIQQEIRAHEARKHECSVYAQLLPSVIYRQLLQRVWEASERGAHHAEIRALVDAFVADLTREGQLSTVPPIERVPPEEPFEDHDPQPRTRRTFPTLVQYP